MFRRRHLRAHLLALLLASGTCYSFALLPLALVVLQPAQAPAPKQVAIDILVIEASKKSKDFDKRLEQYKKSLPGYSGAKILDELHTNAEEKSSVQLEVLKQSGATRMLKVTVKKVEPDGTVKLRVEIEALKFSTDTTHPKGATFIVAHQLSDEKALFLAVTPKVTSP